MAPRPLPTAALSRSRLIELLDAAGRARVTVIGDAMLDVYVRGDVERISPEAPVPVLRVRGRRHALGGAGNVTQNLRALGSACDLVAAIGGDLAGKQLRGMLDGIGAHTTGLVEVSRPTTTKTRIVAGTQQVVRVDEEDDGDLDGRDVTRLLEAALAAIDQANALVLEDYNKGVLVPDVIVQSIARARARKIPIVVDPKFKNFFLYRGATIFKPNRREFESALGAAVDFAHPETLPATFDRLGVEHLLLTLGERGMMLLSAGGSVESVPAFAREVFDVVGAGDTVTAYLAAILAAGGSPSEAAIAANYAAGVEVGKSGAATVSADEVIAAYEAHRLLPSIL